MRIMSMYRPHWMSAVSIITALINSLTMPMHGLIQAKVQFVLFAAYYGAEDFKELRGTWLTAWAVMTLVVSFCSGTERSFLGYQGEALTSGVRKLLMRGVMYKQLSWFDQEHRAPGAITNVMSQDIQLLNGLTTETIIVMIEAVMSISVGVAIAFIYCWPQALVILACSPFLAAGMAIMSRLSWGSKSSGKDSGTKKADVYEKANALLSDMVINYKTVCSFGEDNVDLIFSKFSDLMSEPLNRNIKNAHIAGFAHGYSNCSRMLFMAVIFYTGAIMITEYDYPAEDVYICINVLMHAAMGIGMSLSNLPSVSRAKNAAGKIF